MRMQKTPVVVEGKPGEEGVMEFSDDEKKELGVSNQGFVYEGLSPSAEAEANRVIAIGEELELANLHQLAALYPEPEMSLELNSFNNLSQAELVLIIKSFYQSILILKLNQLEINLYKKLFGCEINMSRLLALIVFVGLIITLYFCGTKMEENKEKIPAIIFISCLGFLVLTFAFQTRNIFINIFISRCGRWLGLDSVIYLSNDEKKDLNKIINFLNQDSKINLMQMGQLSEFKKHFKKIKENLQNEIKILSSMDKKTLISKINLFLQAYPEEKSVVLRHVAEGDKNLCLWINSR